MTKAELIEEIAKNACLSKKDVHKTINALTQQITLCLKKKKKLSLKGFGTFYLSKRKARAGRHPKTGETISIAESQVARFKAGKALRESMERLK